MSGWVALQLHLHCVIIYTIHIVFATQLVFHHLRIQLLIPWRQLQYQTYPLQVRLCACLHHHRHLVCNHALQENFHRALFPYFCRFISTRTELTEKNFFLVCITFGVIGGWSPKLNSLWPPDLPDSSVQSMIETLLPLKFPLVNKRSLLYFQHNVSQLILPC